mmetsp:Transcript_39716/g.60874  ORF Transcript_39716/g.60874 Transcript_39716/m.60874 type:complete len:147 (+) Transcript_39716:309-749(+)
MNVQGEQEANQKAKRMELNKFEEKVDEQQVAKLYKLLENNNPNFLSSMLECMVSLLRGTKAASPQDVKQYLESYKKLMYKFKTVEAGKLPMDAVEHNEKKLQDLTDYFKNESRQDFKINSQYIHLFAWSQHFCLFCKFSFALEQSI